MSEDIKFGSLQYSGTTTYCLMLNPCWNRIFCESIYCLHPMTEAEKIERLEKKIRELDLQIQHLQNGHDGISSNHQKTVNVPEGVRGVFDKSEEVVAQYFSHFKTEPSKGRITIDDQRYLLVRASALSHEFFDTIKNLYEDRGELEAVHIGRNFLFDIAHMIGMSDAKNFHSRMGVNNPIEKLSAGPIHFAYSGWAYVEILPDSNPVPDENYFLIYNHPYSFESDSWIRAGKHSDLPVCIMNCGYSSGWCEESFGLSLTAVEITCKAKGDEHCTFIMAPPHKIPEYLEKYSKGKVTGNDGGKNSYDIPTFFERKKTEEELKSAHQFLDLVLENIPNMIFVKDAQELRFLRFNKAGEDLLGYSRKDLIGKNDYDFFPKEQAEFFTSRDKDVLEKGDVLDIPEEPIETKQGQRWLHTKKIPIIGPAGPLYLVGISEDVTERKMQQDKISEMNEALQAKVEEIEMNRQFLLDSQELGKVGSWERNLSGDVVFGTPEFYRISGFEANRKEPISLDEYYSRVHPDDIEKVRAAGKEIIEKKSSFNIEYRLVLPDNQKVYVWSRARVLTDEAGSVIKIIGTLVDMTEQKIAEREIQKSRERFLKIFELSPVASILSDVEAGKIVRINNAFEKLFSISREEAVGKSAIDLGLITKEERERLVEKVTSKNGKSLTMELKASTADGDDIDLIASLDILEFDNRKYLLSVLVDISDRKKLEDELQQKAEQLESANKELEAFSYSVSHDLRAPLRAIVGFSHILKEDFGAQLNDEGRQTIDTIVKNTLRMGKLIDDILSFSRISRHELEKFPLDMNKIVSETFKELAAAEPESRKIKFDMEQLHGAKGDVAMVTQVITNLLSNALKFTRPKEETVIHVGGKVLEGEYVYFVQDNGVGFDPRYLDKLFGVFQRLHKEEEFEGTGVGLAIVKRVITRHGGRIWAESEIGKGSTFYFTLPENSQENGTNNPAESAA